MVKVGSRVPSKEEQLLWRDRQWAVRILGLLFLHHVIFWWGLKNVFSNAWLGAQQALGPFSLSMVTVV